MALQNTDNFIVSDTSGTNYKISYASLLSKLQADGLGGGGGSMVSTTSGFTDGKNGRGHRDRNDLMPDIYSVDYIHDSSNFHGKNGMHGRVLMDTSTGARDMDIQIENGGISGLLQTDHRHIDSSFAGGTTDFKFRNISSFDAILNHIDATANSTNKVYVTITGTGKGVAVLILNSWLENLIVYDNSNNLSFGSQFQVIQIDTKGVVAVSDLSSKAQSVWNQVKGATKIFS